MVFGWLLPLTISVLAALHQRGDGFPEVTLKDTEPHADHQLHRAFPSPVPSIPHLSCPERRGKGMPEVQEAAERCGLPSCPQDQGPQVRGHSHPQLPPHEHGHFWQHTPKPHIIIQVMITKGNLHCISVFFNQRAVLS